MYNGLHGFKLIFETFFLLVTWLVLHLTHQMDVRVLERSLVYIVLMDKDYFSEDLSQTNGCVLFKHFVKLWFGHVHVIRKSRRLICLRSASSTQCES